LAKKASNPADKHVGGRIRMRRMMLNMSQQELGYALGVNLQQVQKYEKGINRVGAGRLAQISDILQVPITFFYEGVRRAAGDSTTEGLPDAPARKRFKTSSGKYAEVRVLDANTATFGNDLLSVFRENVTKAREENQRLFGSPDRVPKDQ
jgi:transcriptional regulator with XRE-family HTH domain